LTSPNNQDRIYMQDKEFQYVMLLVQRMKKECFTGNIQINFKCGTVSNINKLESIRREDF